MKAVHKQKLTNYLISQFRVKQIITPSDLVDLMWKDKNVLEQLFPSDNASSKKIERGYCEHLVMQLIAANIISFNVTSTEVVKKRVAAKSDNSDDIFVHESKQYRIHLHIVLSWTSQPNNVIQSCTQNITTPKFWEGIDTV